MQHLRKAGTPESAPQKSQVRAVYTKTEPSHLTLVQYISHLIKTNNARA